MILKTEKKDRRTIREMKRADVQAFIILMGIVAQCNVCMIGLMFMVNEPWTTSVI